MILNKTKLQKWYRSASLFPLCESKSKKTKAKDVKNDVLLVLRNGVNVLDPKKK